LCDPSWADKFYTPLNKKLAGKANPDSSAAWYVLSEDYVNQMDNWQEVFMAIIVCYNVALFSLINKIASWYDGITKLLQFSSCCYTLSNVFSWFNFKFNVTLTLAVVALVGDVFEIYMSVLKNLFFKVLGWFSITRKEDEVLIAETPEKP
jgi:hypothetical protein